MSITLPTYANGDTDYVSKMNQTNDTVANQLNALESQLSSALGASVSVGSMTVAMLGSAVACIGTGSYEASGASSTLNVTSGYAWIPASAIVVQKTTSSTISFSGAAAATYYIDVDGSGNLSRVSTQGDNSLWAVTWSGSAFTGMYRVAPVLWGPQDQIDAQTSAAYAEDYPAPGLRFDASEERIVDLDERVTELENSQPYDLTLWWYGKPPGSQVLLRVKLARAVTFADDFTGSTCAAADVAATASAAFLIKKNGTQIGTATYGAGGNVATFSTTGGAVSYAAGDLLEVVAPATPDATLEGIAIVLAGTR